MINFIKRLFGVKKEEVKQNDNLNFKYTPPSPSRKRFEAPVRESSTLRRVYDEPKKDDSVDLLTTMLIADALLSDSSNDSNSNNSNSGFDGGFGGGDYSGGGAGGSWNDSSSSSSDYSSSDSSYDSSSSYDSGSSSSDW